MMTKILAINGSYRDGGITDRTVKIMVNALESSGVEVEEIRLRDTPIEFCINCRECTQTPGEQPGKCVLEDGMADIVDKIEQCDGLILAAPTNLGSVTAQFKRFMERLTVYAYWPWGSHVPKMRKAGKPTKPAILVSSSSAPGILGRWAFGSVRQLRYAARTVGARPVGTLFTGMAARESDQMLETKNARKARKLGERLVDRKV